MGLPNYKTGLALQLILQGTKYYKDDDLNKKVALYHAGPLRPMEFANLDENID